MYLWERALKPVNSFSGQDIAAKGHGFLIHIQATCRAPRTASHMKLSKWVHTILMRKIQQVGRWCTLKAEPSSYRSQQVCILYGKV